MRLLDAAMLAMDDDWADASSDTRASIRNAFWGYWTGMPVYFVTRSFGLSRRLEREIQKEFERALANHHDSLSTEDVAIVFRNADLMIDSLGDLYAEIGPYYAELKFRVQSLTSD